MTKFLSEGDVILLEEGMSVYADVPKHFLYSNCKGDFELAHGKVEISGELLYLSGKYIVYKTTYDGGGTGHGSHDVYPEGHHVFCMKADDHNVRVSFYQSGSFTVVITDIKPIGKATQTWKVE